MKIPKQIDRKMIAPCGVNCFACSAHLNNKKPCPGCRAPEEDITRKSCRNCEKKKCAFDQGLKWCFECDKFPCSRIKDLDKRYKQNYNISLIQNGMDAKADMKGFLEKQRDLFLCRECGGIIDQHHMKCSACGSSK